VWDSVFNVLSGPLLAKLALAALLVAAFLFLRKKDTEGAMVGYALLVGSLALRDLVFSFVAIPALFDASDILAFCAILYLAQRPFRLGWAFWLSLAAGGAASIVLALEALGLAIGLPPDYLRLAALIPVVALTYVPIFLRSDADTPARALSLRSALPLAAGGAAYIVAGTLLGTGHAAFRALAGPFLYCLLFFLVLSFIDTVQRELVSAVDYYEESVDSLYDLLLSTGTAMRSESFLQDVVDNMIRTVVERSGADGGVLLLSDEFEETVSVRAVYGDYPPPFKLPENLPKDPERVESFVRHARFKLGEGILGEVSRTGKNVFVPCAGPDSPLPDNGDAAWLKAGGFIASPLIVRDRIIGAISVVKSGSGSFSERDFDRCKLLANFGSIAVANSFSFLEAAERSDIEREADIAAGMQKNLIPEELPELRGAAFGAFSIPARGVCSDYYDVVQTKADKALLVVGDAAGKGVAAGVVLVMVRSILHLITASTKDAATLLQWVNRGISGKVDSDHYATLCLAAFDASSGAAEIASAGRQSALICRASDGSLAAVEAKSVPIGVARGSSYASSRVELREGDVLVLYTDGVVETMNAQGKQFGLKNLGQSVQRCRALSAEEIAARIKEDLDEFAGGTRPHDDRTALVMKRTKA
jgi:sigma-B regulation protein RsbU (phosphoserine phosphatase)